MKGMSKASQSQSSPPQHSIRVKPVKQNQSKFIKVSLWTFCLKAAIWQTGRWLMIMKSRGKVQVPLMLLLHLEAGAGWCGFSGWTAPWTLVTDRQTPQVLWHVQPGLPQAADLLPILRLSLTHHSGIRHGWDIARTGQEAGGGAPRWGLFNGRATAVMVKTRGRGSWLDRGWWDEQLLLLLMLRSHQFCQTQQWQLYWPTHGDFWYYHSKSISITKPTEVLPPYSHSQHSKFIAYLSPTHVQS